MQPQQLKDEAFIHIRRNDCEFEASGPSAFVERQANLFYINSTPYIPGIKKEENDK